MSKAPFIHTRFNDLNCCVIIPTFNNEKTIGAVIEDALSYTHNVIVVNDGATDNTPGILKKFTDRITILEQPKNLGKGLALRTAFKKALELGYEYAITIDSDGQHFPSDFELFLNEIEQHPGSLIIGARNMNSENVPGGSNFGNKFSNFWFLVETGKKMPDTQSGYRLYPIERMKEMHFFTTRFEFEIEVIVKASWKKIPVRSIPVKIFYAKGDERVTHFRPTKDFTRISFLNVYLVALAFLWYKPLFFIRALTYTNIKNYIKTEVFNADESNLKKSLSVCIGIFFGIVPIWGYQLIAAIAAAYFLKLNKAIVILTANISVPVFLPFILYASLLTGELVTGQESLITLNNISLDNIKTNLYVYFIGATVLSIVAALGLGLLTFVLLALFRKKKTIKTI